MKKWINCPSFMGAERLGIFEVKCPVCGFKETYIATKNAPSSCYIFGEELEIEKENET